MINRGIIDYLKGWYNRLFRRDFEKTFKEAGIKRSPAMEAAQEIWLQLEGGNGLKPSWANGDVKTIRFSNTVSRRLAELICMDIDVKVEKAYGNSAKAEKMQSIADKTLEKLQSVVERLIRLGGIMVKWDGTMVEYIPPERWAVTDYDSSGEIHGAVFYSYKTADKKYYTRAEWHRYEEETRTNEATGEKETVSIYHISNKAFISENDDSVGYEIPLEHSPWADLEKEFTMENMEKPLYYYFKCPYSNTIDPDSPLGVSVFSECIEELRWLDIAMSTFGVEIEDSKPVMFVDENALRFARNQGIKIPRYMQGLQTNGVSPETALAQWQPKLQTKDRIDGINFYLDIISVKVGMDPGSFVFDGQKIMATATQVESSERKTVNTVNAFRNLLGFPKENGKGRIGLFYGIARIMDVMLTLNGEFMDTDFDNYEIYCNFGDITLNPEEEKAFDYQLTQNGFMPKYMFLVKYRGCTEEEAKRMVREAAEEQQELSQLMSGGGLFGEGS